MLNENHQHLQQSEYSIAGGGQPDYPAALSSLQHMDSEQLKDILNNEDKFDQFIRDLPQMKALQEEKEMLLTSNKSLAEYNLSQVADYFIFWASSLIICN